LKIGRTSGDAGDAVAVDEVATEDAVALARSAAAAVALRVAVTKKQI